MPEYAHTLIPDTVDFVPNPKQVGDFLMSLESIGSAPSQASINVSVLSGKVRSVVNPFTGKTETYPIRKFDKLKDLNAVSSTLESLNDYNLSVEGKGPPKLPALEFDFTGAYDFLVRCCLRAEVVSTSDWHDEVPVKRKPEFFGRPCNSKNRLGIFHNPKTLAVIEVPNAGCARFWIEFEFGKMLFPSIKDSLDIIEPSIVGVANETFGVKFVQGCLWCA
jgi:hypothetical protein